MSDKYNNNNNDDINEFFAQFDRAAENHRPSDSYESSTPQENPTVPRRTRSDSARSHASRGSNGKTGSSRRQSRNSEPSARSGKQKSKSVSKKVDSTSKKSAKKFIPLKVAGLLVLGIIMAVGIYVGVIFTTAPKVDTDDIYSMLAQRSVMYDANGNEIENL